MTIEEYLRNRVTENSIVISGLPLNSSNQLIIKQCLENFFALELKVKAKIINSTRLGSTLCVTDVNKFDDKMRIMNSNSQLRQLGRESVYIYPGGTEREKRASEAISEAARDALSKGADVRVGYMKVLINGTDWRWDDKTRQLVKVTNRGRASEIRNVNLLTLSDLDGAG